MAQLCPHNQNPKACLTCFHAEASAPKKTVPAPQSPKSTNPIIARVRQSVAYEPSMPARPAPAPAPVVNGKAAKGPFRYEDNVGAYDENGVWQPPEHRSLIDRQPQHPHKDESKFLK